MREREPRKRAEAREPDNSDLIERLEGEPREIRTFFAQLPRELWQRHYAVVERLPEVERKLAYLANIVEARKSSVEEFKADTERFPGLIDERGFGRRLQGLLESEENMLGVGQTARVKRLTFAGGVTTAVKYLLTPTAKTLSAEGEHDILREVDTVTRVEEEEHKSGAGNRIRVPHPHFYYKNDRLQCYGMEEIKGVTIEQFLRAETPATLLEVQRRDAAREAFRARYADPRERAGLDAELVRFLAAMHTVCLHGDLRPGNVMVDEQGTIYLIDFGQSVDMNTMSDTTRDQFENLQALERDQLTFCVRKLLGSLEPSRQKPPTLSSQSSP